MKNNSTIFTKPADKDSDIVLDREVYLQNAHKGLSDQDFYKEITKSSLTLIALFLLLSIRSVLAQFGFFFHKDPKHATFLFVTKNWLHKVPARQVICNSDYSKQNVSLFQPLFKKVEKYIKRTNHFLKKHKELGNLPKNAVLCCCWSTS